MSRVPSNAVSAPLFAMAETEVRLRAGSFDPTQMVRNMAASKGMTPQEWADAYNKLEPPKDVDAGQQLRTMRQALEMIVHQCTKSGADGEAGDNQWRRGFDYACQHIQKIAKRALKECGDYTDQALQEPDTWFDRVFWPAWPVKENKVNARKAAAKIPAHKRPQVLDGLRRQAVAIAAMERPIHAATWINGQRWEDEVIHRGADATSQALAIVEGRIQRGERPL